MGIEPKFRKFKSVQKLQTIADEMININAEFKSVKDLQDIANEIIGEYNHGTAEYQDCAGVTAEQYKAVLEDFLLYLEGVEFQKGYDETNGNDLDENDLEDILEDDKEILCPKDKNHKVVFSATGYYCDVCKSRIQI